MMNDSIKTYRRSGDRIITKLKPRYVITGKKPNYNVPYAKKAIESELEQMKYEINQSEKGSRSFTGYGTSLKVVGTKSTFPEYMRASGIGSTKDFMKVISQKKGIRKERLKKIAISRLEQGYQNKHGFDMPDMKFKKKTGQVHDNKDIIFRRIGGRIVPIKVERKNRYDLMEEAPF